MPVAGEPMIRRILAWVASHGVADVVLNLHHRPESVTAIVGDGADLGLRVRYSWEQPKILGSAGGPRLALPIVGASTFFLLNGDTLTDVDLARVADAHGTSGALVTLALVPNHEPMRYGGVTVDNDGAVSGFVTRGAHAARSWHFIGVQVVNASVFESLPAGVPLNSIGGVYDELIRARPGSVRAFRSECAFWDVGTPDDYLKTSQAFAKSAGAVGRHAQIDPSATINGSVLWDDVRVDAGASLHDCIVTDGVHVPARAHYERAILIAGDDDIVVTPIAV